MKVLVVDDEPAILATVAAQLETLGHDVTGAADVRQAWCSYESKMPAVVVTDLLMPGGSGVDLCRKIRAARRTRYTFVIVLTSVNGRAQYRAAMEAGADDFLPKPCTQEDLRVRIRVAERLLRLQAEVNTLEGFLPICSYCKQIRDGDNAWHPLREYVAEKSSAAIEDALCPECAEALVRDNH